MEYRIKKEHLNKRIIKGVRDYVLSDDMSQQQILFIKNMVCPDFVEEIKHKKVSKPEKIIKDNDPKSSKKSE